LVKAPDFDSGIRGFESFLPSHLDTIAGSRADRAPPGDSVLNRAPRVEQPFQWLREPD
jgi:hypothetical protein